MKSKDQLYDEILLLKASNGDHQAFSEFVKRWTPKMFYYIKRLVSKDHQVEDILQNVWINLYNSLGRLKNIAGYRVWIFTVARTKAIDHFRGELRHNWEPLPEEAVSDFSTELDAEAVHFALGKLKPAVRDILTLYYLDDLCLEEIGKILAIPVGTVKSRLFHARRILRRYIEEKI